MKILITGGATGIGLGLTERFLQEGNTVIICGRRQDVLKEVSDKNYTTYEFTDKEREILSDGKLKNIYIKAQKYIDVLGKAAAAVDNQIGWTAEEIQRASI